MRNLHLAISILLISFFSHGQDKEITIESNVPFLGKGRKLLLDLYLPAKSDSNAKRPAVLIVHGGGWHTGSKHAAREKNIATNLAKAGYVCASVNYVLAKKKDTYIENLEQVWPQNIQDCMTGVQFLRANAEKYGIDPERIGAIGGSAGGHLVAMLGVLGDRDGLDPKGGPWPGVSCRIQAVVPMYGVHDFPEFSKAKDQKIPDEHADLAKEASPVTHLSRDDPPFLILHGTRDTLVPHAQSSLLHKAAKKAGVKSEIRIITGAKHSFHLQPAQKDLRPLVVDFFDKHLKK